MEPTKIPCLAKGISAGLCVDSEEAWALAAGLQPASTCKRDWSATGGLRRDFMIGCPLNAAAVSCRVLVDRWIAPHLAVRTLIDCCRWTCRFTQPVQRTLLWPASWLPAVDKGRGPSRLQYVSRQDALQLDESLDAGDVSRAWLVWSGAAETALDDAYQFCGPIPSRCLVLGRGVLCSGSSNLGHKVRKARGNASDVHDAADVFLYLDSSLAPLPDMRRRFKAVMVVLGAMIQHGVQDSCCWSFVSCYL